MMHFENPLALWYLLIIIVPILFLFAELKNIKKTSRFVFKTKQESEKSHKNLKSRIYIKTICFSLSWICLVFAFAKPYWGTQLVPIQKSGSSISFVFDVSWSMMARDSETKTINVEADISDSEKYPSRLQNAKDYAQSLILTKEQTDDIASISVVITKGEGIAIVPVTEDLNAVSTAIEMISPRLISSSGTNLASGIIEAINTFPEIQARENSIVVFTDGEETSGSLEKAVVQASNHGINVFIIGFGTKDGSDIFINKNQTKIHTDLKESNIKEMISKLKAQPSFPNIKLEYINSNSENEKLRLISAIYPQNEPKHKDLQQLGYETKNLSHQGLFILLGIILFSAGLFFDHYKISIWSAAGLIIFMTFSSCTAKLDQSLALLEGSFYWQHGNYQKAEVKFLQTYNEAQANQNLSLEQYAVLGLGTSYAMQNEEIAALNRLNSISDDAPEKVKFSASYNTGILYFSQGNYENAAEYFKKAILVNPESLNAKINYELSIKQIEKESQNGTQKGNSAKIKSEQTVLENSLFSIIRENDQNLWKNQQKEPDSQNSLDY